MPGGVGRRKVARTHTELRRKMRHHYYRLMPDRARNRAMIWSIFWITAGLLVVQIIYPLDRTLPLAYWQGQHRGYESELELAADVLKAFDETTVRLKAGEESSEVALRVLGAEPQVATVVDQLREYPFWQRYIPLSLLVPRTASAVPLTYTSSVARSTCERYAAELSRPAINATLGLENGVVAATDDISGLEISGDELCHQIQATDFTLGQTTELMLEMQSVEADKTSADFAEVAAQARQALERAVVFVYEDREFTPSPAVRAGWLRLEGGSDATSLGIDKAKIGDYLDELSQQIGRAPEQTQVRLVDGREAERKEGQPGSEIAKDGVISQAESQLLGDATLQPITLELRAVPPTIIYNNRYTATREGLQAYVTDAAQQYNAHIVVQQLDGKGWRAAAREQESIPSASTYKLYVAMKLFDDMAAGRTDWGSPMLGTTVATCFDRMTIASTNPCAEQWLQQWGREAVNQYLYANGFSRGTSFTHPLAAHSTAADLASYMVRLARGELYADEYRERLLANLGNHHFPYGVPAGSSGKVYDKVGFLWDYVHDAAIVEHSRGRYVVVIMTKGQSYARIALLTREIERIMYP